MLRSAVTLKATPHYCVPSRVFFTFRTKICHAPRLLVKWNKNGLWELTSHTIKKFKLPFINTFPGFLSLNSVVHSTVYFKHSIIFWTHLILTSLESHSECLSKAISIEAISWKKKSKIVRALLSTICYYYSVKLQHTNPLPCFFSFASWRVYELYFSLSVKNYVTHSCKQWGSKWFKLSLLHTQLQFEVTGMLFDGEIRSTKFL